MTMGSCLTALTPPAPLQVHCLHEKQTVSKTKSRSFLRKQWGKVLCSRIATKPCTDWRGFAVLCFVTESCSVTQAELASVSWVLAWQVCAVTLWPRVQYGYDARTRSKTNFSFSTYLERQILLTHRERGFRKVGWLVQAIQPVSGALGCEPVLPDTNIQVCVTSSLTLALYTQVHM